MSNSVCLGLIRRGHRTFEKIVKVISEKLRKDQIHSKSRASVGFGRVVAVCNRCRERQGDYSVADTTFNKQVRTYDRDAPVNKGNLCVTNSEELSALNSIVITQNSKLPSDQNIPIGRSYPPESQGGDA